MSGTRQGSLDGLRGLAAFMVVGYHYVFKGPSEGWLHASFGRMPTVLASYGYLGVHLFFMISGYVIMLTAERASVRSFVASRASRLVPAFWVCCLLTAAVQALAVAAPFPPPSAGQLAGNLTLVPGWLGVEALDGAYWSLQVEITFYLWVGLLVAVGAARSLERGLAPWLALSVANAWRPMYHLELVTCAQWAPLFALGATCYFARARGWTTARAITGGVAAVLAVVYAWREAVVLQARLPAEPWAQAPFVAVIVVVLSAAAFAWLTTRAPHLPASPTTDVLGALTYPLYLVHQNIGYALFNTAAAAGLAALLGAPALAVLVAAAGVALAWTVHVLVERPAGPWMRRVIDPRRF